MSITPQEFAAPQPASYSTPLLLALTATALTGYLAGCATERLDASAPAGVNLTGEWRFDPNLSDDPDKLMETEKAKPRDPEEEAPRGGRGSRGGGGGMPPIGSSGPMGGTGPNGGGWNIDNGATPNFTGTSPHGTYSVGSRESALSGDWATAGSATAGSSASGAPPIVLASGLEQTPPVTTSGAAPGKPSAGNSRAATLHHLLEAPSGLLITQKDSTVAIKIVMPDGTATADEYTAGVDKTIPFGSDTASCSTGWRGPAFIVAIKAKKAYREDDYALDDEGHLIVTTDMKGKRFGTVELKRVYDRVRGS